MLDRLINTCIARQIKCIMYTKLKGVLNLHLICTNKSANWASNMVLFNLCFGADAAKFVLNSTFRRFNSGSILILNLHQI